MSTKLQRTGINALAWRIARVAAVALFSILIVRAAPGQEVSPPNETGFTNLFNGKDLTGWNGDPRLWSVKDGAIIGRIIPGPDIPRRNTFLIWTNGLLEDFELRLLYRFPTNEGRNLGNSGIQYRSKVIDSAKWILGGYQADMEVHTNYSGCLYDEGRVAGGRWIMAFRGEKAVWGADCRKHITGSLGRPEDIQSVIRTGDWNEYVVIAQGNHLQHFINGRQTVDVTDNCEAYHLTSGVLGFQLQGNRIMEVQFKDIRLKRLDPPSTGSPAPDATQN